VVELSCPLGAELVDDLAQQSDHPSRREFEPVDIEDLGPDVTVQPGQPDVRRVEHRADGLHRRTAREREAELLVLVGGRDELVGVGLDADRDPDEHVLDDALLTGDPVEDLDLRHRVDHDVGDATADGQAQLVR